MPDPAIEALKRLVRHEAPGASLAEACKIVAQRVHANWRALHHIVTDTKLPSGKPRGVGRDLREKLERHYPGWMSPPSALSTGEPGWRYHTTGHPHTPADAGLAHGVSLSARSMAPPKIGWEALMTSDLPKEFETQLPDNAMAPRAGKGTRCIFVTGAAVEPGDWVLLRTRDGELLVREYRVLRGPVWEAHALNSAFLPLHSERDDLQILAVLDGIRQRMSSATG